jgi:hypothetical protein
MIKFILFAASAIPVILFVKTVFFRRSTAIKAASSEFEKHVGYLSKIILFVAGIAILYAIVHSMVGK